MIILSRWFTVFYMVAAFAKKTEIEKNQNEQKTREFFLKYFSFLPWNLISTLVKLINLQKYAYNWRWRVLYNTKSEYICLTPFSEWQITHFKFITDLVKIIPKDSKYRFGTPLIYNHSTNCSPLSQLIVQPILTVSKLNLWCYGQLMVIYEGCPINKIQIILKTRKIHLF